MDTTPTQDATPQPIPELMYFHTNTDGDGTTFGSPLTVPPGYMGLVVMDYKAYDAVPAGDYTIDTKSFPELAKKLKLLPGHLPKKRVNLSVFLVNVTGAPIMWSAIPIVTKNRARGLTYCALRGRATVRIADPTAFHRALQVGWTKLLKNQPAAVKAQMEQATVGQQAEAFVHSIIDSATAVAMSQVKMTSEQIAASAETLRESIGASVAASLQSNGLECLSYSIDSAPEVKRVPCGKCGSTTARTAYGTYRRTMSFFYVRFEASREGNFCVPCAAKISMAYNGIILVCGWWGMVGLIVSPFYFIGNCYNFLYAALGPKAACGDAVTQVQDDTGVWPPVPQWGQEVKGAE